MPSNEIVLDIETQNTYQEVGARDNRLLKVSLVGVYFYKTNQYTSYLEHELPKLWPELEHADRVIGYNIKGFDWPVLNNYYPGDTTKFPTLDLLEVIDKRLGFRIKLDAVAEGTLGYGKSGNGLQAVEFFRTGDLEKLRAYCLQDVKVTKEVYEYGLANGRVKFKDMFGATKEIPVDFSFAPTTSRPVNLTIGF